MPNPLVLVNTGVASAADAREIVLPYLDHFGIAYDLLDVMRWPLPPDLAARPLVIVAQRDLDAHGRRLGAAGRRALLEAAERGAGLLSFDPDLVAGAPPEAPPAPPAEAIDVADATHPITARHPPGESLALVGALRVPPMSVAGAQVLLRAGGRPLLAARAHGKGRVALWATPRWAQTRVLGPLAGLDDMLWRSLAWAARKPFVMRGLPPLVAMRVDDVAGATRGVASPFAWAHAARRHGFRPWLGLFIGNLSAPALAELRELVARGDATAFPHAFGRLRDPGGWPYAADLPNSGAGGEEFIYFDHERGRPWGDAEAARRLAAVEAWYAANGPLAISRYAVAHWYELGGNTAAPMADRWGVEFVGAAQDADAPMRDETPWLRLGPFRRHDQPGTSMFEPRLRGDRPLYYADFVTLGGRRLFNCLTEIRDDAGYEWAPDADVAATAARGVRQLRRALDSMALAVLFTHEAQFVREIPPAAWDEALARVAAGIAAYRPILVTLDEGARYVRAAHTGRLAAWDYDPATGRASATLRGSADIPTHVYVFDQDDEALAGRLADVPAFDGQMTVALA